MAEQLLLTGMIDESYLRSMDTAQHGLILPLRYHLIQVMYMCTHIHIAVILVKCIYSKHETSFNFIEDMSERCVMCGAADSSLNHPDYSEWVCPDIQLNTCHNLIKYFSSCRFDVINVMHGHMPFVPT